MVAATKRDGLKALVARLRELPTNRGHKKLERNTYAYRDADGTVRIRYHQTDIITVKPDGEIVITSGGWKTVSTKDRLNTYLGRFAQVGQTKGLWDRLCQAGHSDREVCRAILIAGKMIADAIENAKQNDPSVPAKQE